ncbi:radical SAM protein [Coprothermobacter platensis]|uniref:radical SAM protein n=1 Tax=Coprothermobacter platensis TaxID=108819 RepID=UPI00035C11E4|nr:radical SAM protein [Coprothermobacter platensis]
MFSASELYKVEKPSRYIGGEYNSIVKNWENIPYKVALLYPDLYEVGMSYHGLQLFYYKINGETDLLAERVFTPAPDAINMLKEKNIPLRSLENKKPLSSFDVIAVHFLTELVATNVLETLSLGEIKLFSNERTPDDPYIIAGGPAISNPAFFEPFLDAIFIGEADDIIVDLVRFLSEARQKHANREETLQRLTTLFDGIYVPSLKNSVKEHHVLREDIYYPERFLVPNVEAVQERAVVELMRGCTRGCHFCHASSYYRPVRETPPDKVVELVKSIKKSTGFSEVGLLSLSTFDYSKLNDVVDRLQGEHLNMSLPSLRLDSLDLSLLKKVDPTAHLTLTIAPEAGSDELRKKLNKGFTNEQILRAVDVLSENGWTKFKFYFMVGLPFETEEDVRSIAKLLNEADSVAFRNNRRSRIHGTIASFVPKPFTPFQWERQITPDEAEQKYTIIRKSLKRQIDVSFRDPWFSLLEGVLSRSDEKVSQVVLEAWKRGAIFDTSENDQKRAIWEDAWQSLNLDPLDYLKGRSTNEPLPWDHIQVGPEKAFLETQREKSEKGLLTEDCRYGCLGCGVCEGDLWPTMA